MDQDYHLSTATFSPSVLFTIPLRFISVVNTPDSAFGCVPSVVKTHPKSQLSFMSFHALHG